MPAVVSDAGPQSNQITDRELLLKALTVGQMINEMRQEINDLRQMVSRMTTTNGQWSVVNEQHGTTAQLPTSHYALPEQEEEFVTPEIIEDESISLEEREKHAIMRALERTGGNRKQAAAELHISERTLYRKLKEYDIE